MAGRRVSIEVHVDTRRAHLALRDLERHGRGFGGRMPPAEAARLTAMIGGLTAAHEQLQANMRAVQSAVWETTDELYGEVGRLDTILERTRGGRARELRRRRRRMSDVLVAGGATGAVATRIARGSPGSVTIASVGAAAVGMGIPAGTMRRNSVNIRPGGTGTVAVPATPELLAAMTFGGGIPTRPPSGGDVGEPTARAPVNTTRGRPPGVSASAAAAGAATQSVWGRMRERMNRPVFGAGSGDAAGTYRDIKRGERTARQAGGFGRILPRVATFGKIGAAVAAVQGGRAVHNNTSDLFRSRLNADDPQPLAFGEFWYHALGKRTVGEMLYDQGETVVGAVASLTGAYVGLMAAGSSWMLGVPGLRSFYQWGMGGAMSVVDFVDVPGRRRREQEEVRRQGEVADAMNNVYQQAKSQAASHFDMVTRHAAERLQGLGLDMSRNAILKSFEESGKKDAYVRQQTRQRLEDLGLYDDFGVYDKPTSN